MYKFGPEYSTVVSHWQAIQKADTNPKLATYKNMPFFEDWATAHGGSYAEGARWIVENLGHKPSKDHELHIIDRYLGFIPGNLAWVPRTQHKREEMVAKLLIENRQLRERLAKYESS